MDEIPPEVPGYRLTTLLGTGATSRVWRARREADDELVALVEVAVPVAKTRLVVVERLFDAGALDVYQTPCTMKKGRSGVQLTALCAQPRVAAIEGLLFQHTGTIGLRTAGTTHYRTEHATDIQTAVIALQCTEQCFGTLWLRTVAPQRAHQQGQGGTDSARSLILVDSKLLRELLQPGALKLGKKLVCQRSVVAHVGRPPGRWG